MEEAHVIGRQLFDLHFYSQKEAYNLQTKVSYLFREKLKSILEKQLSAASSPGVIIRIDQLELDLGDIPYEQLEEEFPKRFEEALKKNLPAQVESAWRQPGMQGNIKQLPENMLLLLQLFLLNGHLPWWTHSQQSADPDEWLDTLLGTSPSDLSKMLRKLGKTEPVHRLVRQFSEIQLEKIVRVLEPSEAAFIIAYAHDVDVVHERKPLVQEPAGGFRKAKWLVIFTYLLIERGSQFNRRAFLKSTIAGFAAHYNIDYGTLLLQLSEAAETLRKTTGFEGSLPGIIQSLELEYYEERKSETKEDQVKNTEHTLIQQHFRIFAYFLLHGSLPPGPSVSLPVFDKLVADVLSVMPENFAATLRSSARFPGVLERFAERSKEKTIEQVIKVLEPENAALIIDYSHTLTSIQEKEQLVPIPLKEFKTDKWVFMLRYLLVDRGSHFNNRSFIRSTLTQMAAHYNTAYSKLVALFASVADKQARTRSRTSSLPAILLELAGEESKIESEKKKEQISKSQKNSEEAEVFSDVNKIYDVLHHFFMTGKIAWWGRPAWQKDDIARLLIRLFDESPNLVSTLVTGLAKDENAFDRLLATAGDAALLRILPHLAQGDAVALISWITSLQGFLEQLGGSRKKAETITNLLYRRLLSGFTVTRKNRFDAAAFMNEALGEIAVRYGITARQAMELLADAVDKQTPSAQLVLAALLKKVHERAGAGVYRESEEQAPETETAIVNAWLKTETENQKTAREESAALKSEKEKQKAVREESTALNSEIENKKAANQETADNQTAHWKTYSEAELWLMLAMEEDEERLTPWVPKIDEKQFLELVRRHFAGIEEGQLKILLHKYRNAVTASKKETQSSDEQLLLEALRGHIQMQARAIDELVKRMLRNDPAQLRRILSQVLSIPQLRRRFAASLHETTFVKILSLLYGPSSSVSLVLMSDVLLLVKELVSKNAGAIPLSPIRDLCLLLALRKKSETFTSIQWLQVILSAAGIYSGKQADELALEWKRYLAEFPGDWKSEFPVLLNHLSDPLYLKRLGDRFLARLEKIKEKAAAEERRRQMEERKEKQKMEADMDDERGVFIRNAGLILVWPFLPQLFERVGYVKGISFVSESAAYRAVHLLQYMVNREEQAPEYNLVLNKILCNISKAKPVEKEVVLTDEEKTPANQLLGAVIKHWSVLGETSVEGLQETFLQRGGQLFFFEAKNELRVERKVFDKLLSKIPWSISPVKLPWMNKPLYVEWKT
ncbi:MAG: contractile injection system tape measure protein [Bacteroidota bacterium]|nr:contractile injection system tape measure protein [Bacteroidota bacterium]